MGNSISVVGTKLDLVMTQGTDFGPVTVFLTDENDDAIDMTGGAIVARMQRTSKSGAVISFGTDIPAPETDGKFVFALSASVTSGLFAGPEVYEWNLWITRGGITTPLYFGIVSVDDQVLA